MFYHGFTRCIRPWSRFTKLRLILPGLLVVEDDNSVRETVVTFLEMEGFSVESVASTREALQKLSATRYEIVLSDIYLDERTGLDVLNAAKAANPVRFSRSCASRATRPLCSAPRPDRG